MNTKIYLRTLALFVLALTLVLTNDSFAQRRHATRVVVRGPRRAAVVVNLPGEHTRLVVGGREYFYSRGVYYRTGPHGYLAIGAPIGARLRVLPDGFTTVRVGAGSFFFYYGTYYRFDPVAKEYIVVNPTDSPTPPPAYDHLALVDGTAMDGTYIGGTKSTVQFQVNGEVQEIPIEQIVSITFAPAPPTE